MQRANHFLAKWLQHKERNILLTLVTRLQIIKITNTQQYWSHVSALDCSHEAAFDAYIIEL